MENAKSIIKNTLIYAIGNFGSKALTFLLLPLYSFYLTKDEFGTYDLIIITINLLAPIITLQTSESIYRWLLDTKDDVEKQSMVVFNGFLIITTITVAFYIIYYIIYLLIPFEFSVYFALMLLSSCYLPFFQKILRGLGKTTLFTVSGILYTFLLLLLTIFFLYYLELHLKSLFLASILSGFLVISFIISKIGIRWVFIKNHFDRDQIWKMVHYSFPLVPNSISWWLINAADKYLIVLILNVQANGIYAVSTRFPAIVTLVNSIFLLAWQDHGIEAKENSANRLFFSKLFEKFITMELTLVIFLISISNYLVKYLIDPIYLEAWKYLPFLFIGVAYQAFSSFIGVGYQRAKKTKSIFITSLIGGLINVIISLTLLKYIGLYAPAIGTFVSFFVMYLMRKHQTNHFFKIDVNNWRLFSLTIAAFAFAFLVLFDNDYLNLLLMIISVSVFFVMNKKLISELIIITKVQLSKSVKN